MSQSARSANSLNALNSAIPHVPIFNTAFRIFFLSAGVFSLLAIAIWWLLLNGLVDLAPYGTMMFWHQHEMLFGFVAAAIVGFLLTAVQNWTGEKSAQGWLLLALWSVWISARLAMLFAGTAPWVMWLDLAFLPLATLCLARPIIKVQRYRNLMFVPLLLLMSGANLMMHLAVQTFDFVTVSQASSAMVLLITVLMSILAGRVFPMFTANGTQSAKVAPILALELFTIISTLLIAFLLLSNLIAQPALFAALLIASASAHVWRLWRWRFWITLKHPLLWSLHLSYATIPVGLVLLALHFIEPSFSRSLGLHSLTVGAMGLMIISMMARVSLGHSGRALQVNFVMSAAFIFIFIAFVCRVLLIALGFDYQWLITLSTLSWCLGFLLFVLRYLPILSTARIDGKQG